MTLMSSLGTVGLLVVAMAVVALVETAIPLRARAERHPHLVPNLTLTALTFATNLVWNTALVFALAWLESHGLGLLNRPEHAPALNAVLALVWLDFSFYVAHVAMHAVPGLWRFHRVHHSDPLVDVTTSVRQHPGEGVIRYAFLAVFAMGAGVGPAGFAAYRAVSALNGLLEHANVRAPLGLDRLLSWVTTWPHMHKVHHSRRREETNSNYGNVLSVFDRLFGTFTPSRRGAAIDYGLDGHDDAAQQTVRGLLGMPFRPAAHVRPCASPSRAGEPRP